MDRSCLEVGEGHDGHGSLSQHSLRYLLIYLIAYTSTDIHVLGPTEVEIRAQLAVEEEEESLIDGQVAPHAVTPSQMLGTLMELEVRQ